MRRTVLILSALLVASCSKSKGGGDKSTEAFESHRADLTARVSKILDAAVKPRPPLTADKVDDVAQLDTDWQLSSGRGGNAVVVTEWTAKAIRDGHYFDEKDDERQVTPGGVKVGKFFDNKATTDFEHLMWWSVYSPSREIAPPFVPADGAAAAVDKLLAFRYVVLVRVFELVPGKLTADKKFTPGHVVGEARILDVDGNDHGGVRFAGDSTTPEIKVQSAGDVEDELMKLLTFVALEQIKGKLEKQVGKLNLKPYP